MAMTVLAQSQNQNKKLGGLRRCSSLARLNHHCSWHARSLPGWSIASGRIAGQDAALDARTLSWSSVPGRRSRRALPRSYVGRCTVRETVRPPIDKPRGPSSDLITRASAHGCDPFGLHQRCVREALVAAAEDADGQGAR